MFAIGLLLLTAHGWATLDFTGATNDLPRWRAWVTLTFVDEDGKTRSSAYYSNLNTDTEDNDVLSLFYVALKGDRWQVSTSPDGARQPRRVRRGAEERCRVSVGTVTSGVYSAQSISDETVLTETRHLTAAPHRRSARP